MAAGGMKGEGSLRPFHWPRRPGGGTLLRAALVTVLLGLALIVMDDPSGCPTGAPPPAVALGTAGPPTAVSHPAGCPTRPTGTMAGSAAGGQPGRAPGTPNGRPAPRGAGGTAVPGAADGNRAGAEEIDRPAGGDAPVALPLPSGFVGVPVRLAEPAALAVLRPGARVDLLVSPAGRSAGAPVLLAADALVLDVVGAGVVDGSSALYLAVRPDQAQRSVGQPEGSRFSVVIRG
ncbi:flagellar biosynthesis protein FlgA [Micromonospora matsumotoense]|uniref:flagellar biosynthesis protein FlgA n=1 Tax=Micromonospora matsumotoense TaxID=121616 RepID=UPI003429789C